MNLPSGEMRPSFSPNRVCSHGVAFRSPDSESVHRSCAVFRSSIWKTMVPAGDQCTGRIALPDSYSNSSGPELSARLRYRPHLIARREANTISDPSGDQTGDELS